MSKTPSKNQFPDQFEPLKAPVLKTKRLTYIEVALSKPNSRKYAIFAKCWDCCGGQPSKRNNKGVRAEIRNCEIYSCSLHQFRPYQTKKPAKVAKQITGLDLSFKQNHEENQNEK